MRVLCATVVALALVGGAAGAAAPPETIVPDVLTVGLNLPSPGFQVGAVRPSNTVVAARGLEIDFARSLATRLGVRRVHLVNEPSFKRLLARGDKTWDIALAEVTITPARRESVDLSSPYLRADQGVLMRKTIGVPRSLAALARLRICLQRGTTSVEVVRGRVHPTRPLLFFASLDLMFDALRVGRCDAAVLDAPILAAERVAAPDRYGPLAGVLRTNERYGVVLQKNSMLTTQVDAAVRALVANGTLSRLQRRWLSTDLSRLPVLR
jgi:polar amino acid transport system substrate-binding protein